MSQKTGLPIQDGVTYPWFGMDMNDGRFVSRPILTRFMEKVSPQPNGCWLWTGCSIPAGYGQLWVRDRVVMAHRVSHELFKGPVPERLCIDHLCRVTSCVNPAHLEAVTYTENTRRGTNAEAIRRSRAAKRAAKARQAA
jgi:hypothetical protein